MAGIHGEGLEVLGAVLLGSLLLLLAVVAGDMGWS